MGSGGGGWSNSSSRGGEPPAPGDSSNPWSGAYDTDGFSNQRGGGGEEQHIVKMRGVPFKVLQTSPNTCMMSQAQAFQPSGDRDGDIGVVRLLRQHPRSQHYVWSRWKTQRLGNRRHKRPFFSVPENFRYFGQEIDYIGILDFLRLKTRQKIGLMKEELNRHFHIVAYIYTQVIIDISG